MKTIAEIDAFLAKPLPPETDERWKLPDSHMAHPLRYRHMLKELRRDMELSNYGAYRMGSQDENS